MNKKILVINAGSSTIKWKIFLKENLEVYAEGLADRIFVDGIVQTKFNGEKFSRETTLKNHTEAAREVLKDLVDHKIISDYSEIELVGNRVVQGGDVFSESIILDENKIKTIDELSVLAPLHNPGAVETINAFKNILPHAKLTATFDTSFHTTIPAINSTYPINQKLAHELKIKKYGMHGTSHRFITMKLEEILGRKVTFINAHIGNGASLCAVKDSKSFDTSMGLTPLAGVMMGTRCGDIDPSIVKFIMENKHIDVKEVDKILNKESGLKGVSGISQDMRDVLKAAKEGNAQAQFTIDLYASKVADYISMYFNKLGGKIDGIVFTAGVGENSMPVRKAIVDQLHFTKIELDDSKNNGSIGEWAEISSANSNIKVYVIRTDEELLIAKDALELTK